MAETAIAAVFKGPGEGYEIQEFEIRTAGERTVFVCSLPGIQREGIVERLMSEVIERKRTESIISKDIVWPYFTILHPHPPINPLTG